MNKQEKLCNEIVLNSQKVRDPFDREAILHNDGYFRSAQPIGPVNSNKGEKPRVQDDIKLQLDDITYVSLERFSLFGWVGLGEG